MAENVSKTLKVLDEVRAEIRATNARLDDLSGEVDGLKGEVEQVKHAMREGFLRVSTEIVALHGTLQEVRDALVERRDDRHRLDDHERRIRVE